MSVPASCPSSCCRCRRRRRQSQAAVFCLPCSQPRCLSRLLLGSIAANQIHTPPLPPPTKPSTCRNHGGILIVWDRMFGTFQEERKDRKPIYGLNAQVGLQAGRQAGRQAGGRAGGQAGGRTV